MSFFFVEQLSLAIITLMNTRATTSQTIGSSLTKPRTSRSRSQNFTNSIGQCVERERERYEKMEDINGAGDKILVKKSDLYEFQTFQLGPKTLFEISKFSPK